MDVRSVTQVDRLERIETWLYRLSDRPEDHAPRFALILDFIPVAMRHNSTLLSVGETFEACLIFYASAAPLRAIIETKQASLAQSSNPEFLWQQHHATPTPQSTSDPSQASSLPDLQRHFPSLLAKQPWIDQWPYALNDVQLAITTKGQSWLIHKGTDDQSKPSPETTHPAVPEEPRMIPLASHGKTPASMQADFLLLAAQEELKAFGFWNGSLFEPIALIGPTHSWFRAQSAWGI